MTARQFFDVWTAAVTMVASARPPRGLPVYVARTAVASELGARHGERIAREGQAYFDRLLTDCQRSSAGEST